jgi:hypothetical protein
MEDAGFKTILAHGNTCRKMRKTYDASFYSLGLRQACRPHDEPLCGLRSEREAHLTYLIGFPLICVGLAWESVTTVG